MQIYYFFALTFKQLVFILLCNVICITTCITFVPETINNYMNPKGKPTKIYTIRFDEARLLRLKKRHGVKLYNYLKEQMDKIHDTKRIPCTDND